MSPILTRIRQWLFPARGLGGITKPTRVTVEGVLLGEDDQSSEVTGRRGVCLEYRFYDRVETSTKRSGRGFYDGMVTWGRIGDVLRVDVDGRVLLVPIDPRVKFEFVGEWDPGMLPALLPDSVAAAHPELNRVREEIRYDEKALHGGQRLKVTAFVAPVARAEDAGAYRGGRGPGWDFEVRPELSNVTIEELPVVRL